MDELLNKKITVDQFNIMAPDYGKGLWGIYFRYSYKKAIKAVRQYIKSYSKILDLGCGTGGLTIILFSLLGDEGEVIGIDVSPKMIDAANAFIENDAYRLENKKIKFINGEAGKLLFPNNYFDLAFCLNSFHHHFDQRSVLNEVYRVLAPGGIFVLVDPFLDNPFRKFWGLFLKFLFHEPYVLYHTRNSLRELFEQTKMTLLRQEKLLYFVLISVYKKNN